MRIGGNSWKIRKRIEDMHEDFRDLNPANFSSEKKISPDS